MLTTQTIRDFSTGAALARPPSESRLCCPTLSCPQRPLVLRSSYSCPLVYFNYYACEGDVAWTSLPQITCCGARFGKKKRKNQQQMTITAGEWLRMLRNQSTAVVETVQAPAAPQIHFFPIHDDPIGCDDERRRQAAAGHELHCPVPVPDLLFLVLRPPGAAPLPAPAVEVLPGPRRPAARSRRRPPLQRYLPMQIDLKASVTGVLLLN